MYQVEWYASWGQWEPVSRHWFYWTARRALFRKVWHRNVCQRWRIVKVNESHVLGLMIGPHSIFRGNLGNGIVVAPDEIRGDVSDEVVELRDAARALCDAVERWEESVERILGRLPESGTCTRRTREAIAALEVVPDEDRREPQ